MTAHPRQTRRTLACALALSLGLVPLIAQAHFTGSDAHHANSLSALVRGLQHPFTGLDHLAALLALGLWAATKHSVRLLPILGFLVAMVSGAAMSLMGLALPVIEPMIAASVFVLGLLAASRTHLPGSVGMDMGMAAIFGLFHGAAHGLEVSGPLAVVSVSGVLMGSMLILASACVASRWDPTAKAWMPRFAGACIAVLGWVWL